MTSLLLKLFYIVVIYFNAALLHQDFQTNASNGIMHWGFEIYEKIMKYLFSETLKSEGMCGR